jgi:hypothetical protein
LSFFSINSLSTVRYSSSSISSNPLLIQ